MPSSHIAASAGVRELLRAGNRSTPWVQHSLPGVVRTAHPGPYREPSRIVGRSEVLAALPGTSLDPHVAEVAVARLRDTTSRDLIRTVVKRGYRLQTVPS